MRPGFFGGNAMNEFTTETDPTYAGRARMKLSLIIGLGMTICNLFSITISVSLFLLIEVVICSVVFLCVSLPRRNQDWTLHFEGDELHVTNNMTGDHYEIYAIPTTDFCFRQTKRDKEMDYGDLTIRHTIFGFPSVKNISETKVYIQEHFSKYNC